MELCSIIRSIAASISLSSKFATLYFSNLFNLERRSGRLNPAVSIEPDTENIILEVDCWHWLIKLKIALSHSSFLAIKSISSIQIKSILLMESNTLGS